MVIGTKTFTLLEIGNTKPKPLSQLPLNVDHASIRVRL
jgi:hypothetical protein